MDKNIHRSINKYIRLIKENFEGIENAYLFGSYAKGNPTSDSDIDIALIFKSLDDTRRFNVQVQLMLLAAQIDSRIEPHPIAQDDFNAGNSFFNEIKKTGIKIAA